MIRLFIIDSLLLGQKNNANCRPGAGAVRSHSRSQPLDFLLMWPTILTLAMFPVMVVVYIRLAR